MVGPDLGRLVAEARPADPNVRLPADVRTTIERGDAAFKEQKRHKRNRAARGTDLPRIITAVTDQSVQEQRDANLDARERPPKGNRRQPPMVPRLRAAMIVVDRLEAEGVPFAVGPKSRMNKALREWLNHKANRSPDPRPSRRKEISGTAVRELLKQIRAQGPAVARSAGRRKPTTQEVARERLRELRARGAD